MSIPLAEIYQRTGAKLEILRADESLGAEDGELIAETYAGLHDQLLTEGLMTWGVTDEVPEWAALIVVDMLAAMLVDQFGLEEPRRSIVVAEGILGNSPVSPAERKLRRQLAQPYINNVVQTEYF
jgi:hypothetical protein